MPIPALVCELLRRSGPVPPELSGACGKLAPVLDGLVPLPSAAEVITALQSGQPPPVPGLAVPTEKAPAAPQAALPLPGLPAPSAQPEGERTPETTRAESTTRVEPDDDSEGSDRNRGTEQDESEERSSGLSGLFGGDR
jgi:hypothetical protein